MHLLRNSFRYAGRQHWDAIAKALRPVYTAPAEAAATERFLEFAQALGRQVSGHREALGERLGRVRAFLAFDPEIRRVICSTDESVNGGVVAGFLGLPRGLACRRC